MPRVSVASLYSCLLVQKELDKSSPSLPPLVSGRAARLGSARVSARLRTCDVVVSLPSLSCACVAPSAVLSWRSLGCLSFPALGLCVLLRAVACTSVACVMPFSHHFSRIRDQVAMGVLRAGGYSSPARTPIDFIFPALPYPFIVVY